MTGRQNRLGRPWASAARRLAAGLARLGAWLILALPEAGGDPYSIAWYTVDGGGGTCTGGSYRVSCTSGQPDAGRHTSAPCLLGAGYWPDLSGALVYLWIARGGTNLVLRWEDYAAALEVEESEHARPAAWSWTPESKSWSNDQIRVSVPVERAGSNRVFRLSEP